MTMGSRRTKLVALLLALGAWLVPASLASAERAPAWQLSLISIPTNLVPGSNGSGEIGPLYAVTATNIGTSDAVGPVTLTATLPAGITPVSDAKSPSALDRDNSTGAPVCSKPVGQTVTCTTVDPVHPSRVIAMWIPVKVSGLAVPGEVLPDVKASVSSPNTTTVLANVPTTIATEPAPFDFLPNRGGLSALFTQEDGSPAIAAGSHPDQLTVTLGLPVEQPTPGAPSTGVEHPRDIVTDLPPGVIANPNASAVRCTEAELLSGQGSDPGCPAESQIGMVTVVTDVIGPRPELSALYNMVPPPGSAGMVAFNGANVGIYIHLKGGVRSETDFGIYTETSDALARDLNPIEGAVAQVWGAPTSTSHDQIRDRCRVAPVNAPCSVNPLSTSLLSMPSACSDNLTFAARMRSWEESNDGITGLPHETIAPAIDLVGTEVGVSGCSLLEFDPLLTLQPDTTAAESPTGVEIELGVPQSAGDDLATSTIKDVTVTFPEGLVANAAAADGQKACSPAQIGMITPVGESAAHFSADRPQCPDAAKLGTLEVTTPVLDHALPGAVYLAEPYQNPFGTLLAAYLVIDSPRDGLAVKLASRVEADPDTGRLTATITESPQLPFSEVKVNLFGGPRAALRTPSTCGTYTTDAELVPWSGGEAEEESSAFQIAQGANGAPCASSEADMPNDPYFEAGTATPIAATYSPFLGRLARNDGEQRLQALNATLPPGLTGKLAGVQTCTEAALAVADAKSGKEELSNPSCPSASQIGEVKAGAGAGPSPYYTTGKIYLAGPYKSAPLSGVAIVPAVAGPFDLGNVVIRAPTYVDPVTAQLSLRSDSFPHILEGIPLGLRDARLQLTRSEFTLNPTSCSEKAISGEAVSLLGDIAPLAQRFQVGGCRGLDYAPELFIRLKGGTKRGAHPKLRAVLEAKPGQEANTARASVALPRSEFIENAHFQTVCTRVQFAADQCPLGSIYGHVKAITPLLDEPLEGAVYLRSSSHQLPDVVATLHGPPDKPIEVELAGRIDSANGGIRTTFEAVPDQPVKKVIFTLKGGNKGLFVNSRDICAHVYRATAKFDGQNGKTHDFKPKLNASCGKDKAKGRHK